MTDGTGNRNCDMREALVSYLYDEATAAESSAVEAHLSGCAACRQEFASFERVRGLLQEWQLDDLPVVRVETAPARRTAFDALKELFSLAPLWAKLAAAGAMALLVLAVMGTEVRIGGDGFSMRADLLRRGDAAPATVATTDSDARLEMMRAEIKAIVDRQIAESEQQQAETLKAQLASFESELQNMRASDLAKLAARIQEHQAKIKTIERDIDRRAGLDLTDILFSELTSEPTGQPGAQKGGD